MESLPIVSLDVYRSGSKAAHEEALKAAQALEQFGALVVKDSRVTEADNDIFLDLMEDYFAQPQEVLEKDTRPEHHFQVGSTLEHTEKPVCTVNEDCRALIQALDEAERPLDLAGTHKDPKCRFFHRMGKPSPTATEPELENITPQAFADVWTERMDKWGTQMQQAVEGVAQMAAEGLGLDKDCFTDAGKFGNHLLAPTATNLGKYGDLNSIMAGFHSDLNFLTIHGRSRYPGLHIWARNSGRRIEVKMPPGYLLVQSGKQLEHLTAGRVLAGFHEVVVNARTVEAMKKADQERPDRPKIRISSTFFWHLSPEFHLDPIKEFIKPGEEAKVKEQYPNITVAEHLAIQLRSISLANS